MKLIILEEVQTQGDRDRVVYLPHTEVIKEGWSTTMSRIVFDLRAKYKDAVSLNEVSHIATLYSLLLKSFVHSILLTGDIGRAYLQINIDKDYRDYFRFLWYSNLQEASSIKYRFCKSSFWCYIVSILIEWICTNICIEMLKHWSWIC